MDLSDALIDWDAVDNSDGNVAHVAEHGLTPDEVDSVLRNSKNPVSASDSSGLPVMFGHTTTGRYIIVVFDMLRPADPRIVRPVTAYEVPEPAE